MTKSGNGDGPSEPKQTPLEKVEELVEARRQEEDAAVDSEAGDDPLYAWKDLPANASREYLLLHRGLLAISQIAEAAIESNIRNRGDIARIDATLKIVRKDVQSLKDEVREIRTIVAQIPTIKSMLVEILDRLPDPKSGRPE